MARIAELTRTSTDGPSVGLKNSRNFVFATLSPEKVEENSSTETAPVQVGCQMIVTAPCVQTSLAFALIRVGFFLLPE